MDPVRVVAPRHPSRMPCDATSPTGSCHSRCGGGGWRWSARNRLAGGRLAGDPLAVAVAGRLVVGRRAVGCRVIGWRVVGWRVVGCVRVGGVRVPGCGRRGGWRCSGHREAGAGSSRLRGTSCDGRGRAGRRWRRWSVRRDWPRPGGARRTRWRPVAPGPGAAVAVAADHRPALGGGEVAALGADGAHRALVVEQDGGQLPVAGQPLRGGGRDAADAGQRRPGDPVVDAAVSLPGWPCRVAAVGRRVRGPESWSAGNRLGSSVVTMRCGCPPPPRGASGCSRYCGQIPTRASRRIWAGVRVPGDQRGGGVDRGEQHRGRGLVREPVITLVACGVGARVSPRRSQRRRAAASAASGSRACPKAAITDPTARVSAVGPPPGLRLDQGDRLRGGRAAVPPEELVWMPSAITWACRAVICGGQRRRGARQQPAAQRRAVRTAPAASPASRSPSSAATPPSSAPRRARGIRGVDLTDRRQQHRVDPGLPAARPPPAHPAPRGTGPAPHPRPAPPTAPGSRTRPASSRPQGHRAGRVLLDEPTENPGHDERVIHTRKPFVDNGFCPQGTEPQTTRPRRPCAPTIGLCAS